MASRQAVLGMEQASFFYGSGRVFENVSFLLDDARYHAVVRGYYARIARELNIFLGDMRGSAANLDIRAVGIERPGQRIGSLAVGPAAHPLLVLLVLPHMSAISCLRGSKSTRREAADLVDSRRFPWEGSRSRGAWCKQIIRQVRPSAEAG